jgi:hypothetical protein
MIALVGAAAFVVAATTVPVEGPAPMSENVARVRLTKLGYTNVQTLKRNGAYWEATVIRNGTPQVIRFNALTGGRSESSVRRPLPITIKKPPS